MLLKRFYKTPLDWVKQINDRMVVRDANGAPVIDPPTKEVVTRLVDPSKPQGACLNPPPLDYVSCAHTGVSPEQNFSAGLINAALSEGWATISKGVLTLHVVPEDLIYTIKRMPGRYCCHCGEKLPDDSTGELARGHVATAHPGAESPDPSNPAGYCMTSAYECVLDAAQHERFRVRKAAKPPVFARKEAANG